MDDGLIRVLLIEDDLRYAWLVREMLATERGIPFRLECASRLSTGLDRLATSQVDVLLLDLSLPGEQGLEAFFKAQAQAPDVPLVVLTGLDDQALAMKAIQKGAQDYLVKGRVDGDQLISAMRYAIERKRVEKMLMQQYHELALLNRAIQAFSSTLDLDRVLATVLDEVRHLLNVAACSIWLVEPRTGDLICREATGTKWEVVQGWRLSPGEGLAGWVASHGGSLIVADALLDERHFLGLDQITGLELRSVLSVPLQVRERMVGVLQVLDTEANRFSAADLTLLEPLATAAAAALENARLYEETERLRAFNEKIVHSMEEGILLDDAAGHITFVNSKTAELLGYAPDELVGQHRNLLFAPEYMVEVEKENSKLARGVPSRYDVELLTKDGGSVPVIVSAKPLFNEGRFSGVLSVLIRITDGGGGGG